MRTFKIAFAFLLMFFIISKSNAQSAVLSYKSDTICKGGTYQFNGLNLTQAGTYKDTLPSSIIGIDSIITLMLKVNPGPILSISDSKTLCLGTDTIRLKGSNGAAISWQLNGNNLTVSNPFDSNYVATNAGIYSAHVTNSFGCTSNINIFANCNGQTTVLSYKNDTTCFGKSYAFNGQNLSQSGIYKDTLPSFIVGIDSVITLTLQVNPSPSLTIADSKTLCLGVDTIWLKGSNGFAVNWELNNTPLVLSSPFDSTYVSNVPGVYSASVTNGFGCKSKISLFANCLAQSAVLSYKNDTICSGMNYSFNGQSITQSGTYKDTLPSSIVGVDSIITLMLKVNPSPVLSIFDSKTFCQGVDTLRLFGSNGFPVTWKLNDTTLTTPSPFDSVYLATKKGMYAIISFNQFGCRDSINLTVNCSDSVWPGDADHNGIADNNDLLPIGIAQNLSGPIRPNASILWTGQYCTNWGVQLLNGTNIKHTDCNGDGLINPDDTFAIIQNFGLIHSKKENEREEWRAGTPALFVFFDKDTVRNGDILTASIQLGDNSLQVSNFYGVAFTFNYDSKVVDTSKTYISYPPSWIGNSSEKISIRKDLKDVGELKTAVTRINHFNVSGNGEIAQVHMIITTDNINGIKYYNNVSSISLINAIDSVGNPITLNAGIDSVVVETTPTDIETVKQFNLQVYPNPASGTLFIKSEETLFEQVSITNLLGESVLIGKLSGKNNSLDVSDLPSGIYLLKLKTAKGELRKRIYIYN